MSDAGQAASSRPINGRPNSPRRRVVQLYNAYLDSLYEVDYYKRFYNDTTKYSRHFEFIIALSGALSGGSGLGILASSWMAVPCSVLTAVALILSVAKQAYNWPAKSSFAVDMIERNGRIVGKLKDLVQDVRAAEEWDAEFEKRFDAVRSEVNTLPQNMYPELKYDVRCAIQDAITNREQPQTWWKPTSNDAAKETDHAAA